MQVSVSSFDWGCLFMSAVSLLSSLSHNTNSVSCTLDVTSLYTNIPHLEGIQSIKEMLAIHKPPNTLLHNSYIIELLELVLTNNHFEFNGEFYHQLSCTAMGTKLTPSYANLFMTKFKDKYVYTYLNNHYCRKGS